MKARSPRPSKTTTSRPSTRTVPGTCGWQLPVVVERREVSDWERRISRPDSPGHTAPIRPVHRYYQEVRAEERFADLIEVTKRQALEQNSDRVIDLVEGAWHPIRLEGESGLPEVDLSLHYDEDAFSIRATIRDDHFAGAERARRVIQFLISHLG